ncbi:MAG: hypothetical protein RJA61_371 [Candidatus Parcubacteria bacterium]|jgi:hypothetical protein
MPEPIPPKDKIDRLSRALYERGAPSIIDKKVDTVPQSFSQDVKETWQSEERIGELIGQVPQKKKKSFLKIFFVTSLSFFIIALSVALFAIFGDFNNISSKNVDISVVGPVSISGGEDLTLEIVIENKNNTTLETADLLIEYPAGTRTVTDLQRELLRYRESLGAIESGGVVRRTVTAVLFGQKDSIQNISISVEYRVKGSNAVFSKEKKHEIALTSSPITLTTSYPKEIASGKEFEIAIEALSNATSIIKQAVVKVEYPFGFAFTKSVPQPSASEGVWRLGDLRPGEKRTIKITGKIEGQDNEERTFRFVAGVASERDENILGVEFISLLETLAIKKPGIGLELVLDGSTNTSVTSTAGGRVSGTVRWVNNLSVPVVNGKVEVRFTGGAFDKASVSVSNGGFYRSIDNTIVWDRNSNPELADMAPGKRGDYGFSFSTASVGGGLPLSNQTVTVGAFAQGSQFSGGSVPEALTSSITRTVQIASDIGLNTRIVHSTGPFVNLGTLPPRVEKETTYTIIWNATNSSNDVTGVVMKAKLPSYVNWLNSSVPSQEQMTFNSIDRTITWNVGDLSAGTGFTSTAREVSFQVSFLPSLSQLGTSPEIIGETVITGRDRFTSAFLERSRSALTTRLGTDPAFKNGDEKVSQ